MTPARRGALPRTRILVECQRVGVERFVAGCVAILSGEIDEPLLVVLGGPLALAVLSGQAGGSGGYWPRVWALRGLLHAYAPAAAPAVRRALGDPAWRAREMAAKVVARHLVGECFEAVEGCRRDPVARVRAAAERAVFRLAAASA